MPQRDGFLGPEGKRNGISALAGLDFEYVHADVELDGRRFADVGVRLKGNATYSLGADSGKTSYKIDLNRYVKGQKLEGISVLNLHSTITDAGWMNEPLAYRLYRDAGTPAPRTAYARVSVTVPGQFARRSLGLYTLVENIDNNFAVDRFGVPGGAIYKPVTRTPFRDLGEAWPAYNQTYDPKTDLTVDDQRRIIDFCKLVSHSSDSVFGARIGDFVDLPAFATYMAVMVWLSNPDSLLQQGQNYYVYLHPKTRRLSFLPWDQDHSFGVFPHTTARALQQLDIFRPWTRANRFLERMFRVDAFVSKYVAELDRLSRTVFQPVRLAQQVDELALALRPIVRQESTHMSSLFEKAVAGQPFPRPHYGGTVTPIKPFALARHASVTAQLRGRSLSSR